MVKIKDIPYRSLPNQLELFLRYVDLSPTVLPFYSRPPVLTNVGEDLRKPALSVSYPRAEMASILRRQNEEYGGGPATLDSISRLEHPDCVAVVTGQQVGLFGGPLYTIYKALTAVNLSHALEKQNIRSVPVFWMETEDHDLAEVTLRTVLDRKHTARRIDYRKALYGHVPEWARSVGSIPLPETITEVVGDFTSHFDGFGWKDEIESLLKSTYRPGSTFAKAFASLIHRILPDSGLILFDPQDPQAKPLAAGVFLWALENSREIRARMQDRNREIESAGFRPQVRTANNATVLFFIEKGERCGLEDRKGRFCLKNRGRYFSLDQLRESLETSPARFSPNVLLRPIVQDTLLPTCAYVAGPAEVAYFAQIQALYALRNHPMPVIWPRESFTLLDAEIFKTMKDLGIEIEECFSRAAALRGKALRNSGISRSDSSLEAFRLNLEETFTELSKDAGVLDPSLPQAMDTAKRKILRNLHRIRARMQRLEENSNTEIVQAADLLLHHCLPNGNLQERELSILHFLAQNGPNLLDAVRSSLRLSSFSHRVILPDASIGSS
jgi:bacillithiol biosynthesis cysteine-adding enzyme BshC